MSIAEEINRQIKHIEQKIIAITGADPRKTPETVSANYWCGRQTASTTTDFIYTLQSLGIISTEEHANFFVKISNLNNDLVRAYNKYF